MILLIKEDYKTKLTEFHYTKLHTLQAELRVLFIAGHGRSWKLGILILEAPRNPPWQSSGVGVLSPCPISALDHNPITSQPLIGDK